MIEEPALPIDAKIGSNPALPIFDRVPQIEPLRKLERPVNVIGHGEEQRHSPIPSLFPKGNRLKQPTPNSLPGQLVPPTRLTVDGDEKSFLGRIDPVRDIVRQGLPVDEFHELFL